jgi:hypothetical protein
MVLGFVELLVVAASRGGGDDPSSGPLISGKWRHMASEAICIAISVGSALGGMLGDFKIKEVGDQEKFLRIAPNKRSGIG